MFTPNSVKHFKLKTEMYASLEHGVCECQNSV